MALERLEFEGPDASYHSYLAAQHVTRYAAVKDVVKGKRVLDVACGAGYGVRLLSDWGAAEVVGIDIAPAAIATAKRIFNGSGCTFLSGDAEALETLLDGEKRFDVIVSFETIEHLTHPERLLNAIRRLRAPHGIVAISCPNDKIYQTDKGGNPFHLNNFTFEEFTALCERHLGSATQWLLGAPVHGEINFVVGDVKVETGHTDAKAIAAPDSLDNALLLGSQNGLEVDAASCSHYIGFWGAEPGANAVISAQSVSSYRQLWLTLDWLKRRTAELERDRKALLREVQDLRARVLYYADQQHQARIAELEARLVSVAQFEGSRSYRAWRRFQVVYRLPVIGPVMRGMRRAVGAVVRR